MLYGASQKVVISLWCWLRPIAPVPDAGMKHLRKGKNNESEKKTKYVHEGQYVAEVEVALLEDDTGWSPYLSIEDIYKLDDVREALRQRDLQSTAKYGRIYELLPVVNQ